jgi:hypothetical protein
VTADLIQDRAEQRPTYGEHLTSTRLGQHNESNYIVDCTCGWKANIATLRDEFAAESALRHVKAQNDPTSPFYNAPREGEQE